MKTTLRVLDPSAKYNRLQLTIPVGSGPSTKISVDGSGSAIIKLQSAFHDEHLSLPDSYALTGGRASDSAIQYHRQKGSLPTDKEYADTVARWRPLGVDVITSEDYKIDRSKSLRAAIQPPIRANSLDMDEVAMMLRVVSRVQSQGRVFEIGIVTINFDSPIYQVDIIPTIPNAIMTDIFWLVRKIDYRPSGRGMQETWNTLTSTHAPNTPAAAGLNSPNISIMPTVPEKSAPVATTGTGTLSYAPQASILAKAPPLSSSSQGAMPTMPAAPAQAEPKSRSLVSAAPPTSLSTTGPATSLSAAPATSALATLPPPTPLDEASNESDLLVKHDPSAGAAFTDEQILNGAIQPEEITGDIILRLGLRYSNKELATRINVFFVDNNKPTRTPNNYTKRVTLAFDTRVQQLAPRYPSGDLIPHNLLKKQYDQYRFVMGLRSRPAVDGDYLDKGIKKDERNARPNTAHARRKRKEKSRKASKDAEQGDSTKTAYRQDEDDKDYGADGAGMDFAQMGGMGFAF